MLKTLYTLCIIGCAVFIAPFAEVYGSAPAPFEEPSVSSAMRASSLSEEEQFLREWVQRLDGASTSTWRTELQALDTAIKAREQHPHICSFIIAALSLEDAQWQTGIEDVAEALESIYAPKTYFDDGTNTPAVRFTVRGREVERCIGKAEAKEE